MNRPKIRRWPRLAIVRFGELWRKLRRDKPLCRVFGVVLAIDLAWILWFMVTKALHNAEITERWYDLKHLRIVTEGGYPEMFNYAKTFVVIVLLWRLAVADRRFVYLALAIVFSVVLIDDSTAIHESWGEYFVDRFDIEPAFGLRNQDIGEVITWALLGTVLGPLLLVGLLRASGKHFANGLALLIPFCMLLFCAIVVDQLYNANSQRFWGAGILIDAVEDGGEMIAITLMGALSAVLLRSRKLISPVQAG